jgi:hypothetical protein
MAKKRGGISRGAPAEARSYRVFLSHATHDKFIAKVLCDKIEELGAATFRDDRDIEGGDAIPAAIQANIRDSDELLVLLTPQSSGREWVLIEIGIAIGVQRRIVPVFYHIDPKDVPGIIKDNRGFHLNDLGDYLEDLRNRIERL